MKREKDAIGMRTKSLVLGAIAFVVGALPLAQDLRADKVVYNATELRNELENQNGDPVIILANGDYAIDSSLKIMRSVTLRAQNSRQATLLPSVNVLQHDGFYIDDSIFFSTFPNPMVSIEGLVFLYFDRAIKINPNATSGNKTLDLTVREEVASGRGKHSDREQHALHSRVGTTGLR